MSQLAQVHATPGVAPYMAEVEAGLARAIAAQPGLAQEVSGEAQYRAVAVLVNGGTASAASPE